MGIDLFQCFDYLKKYTTVLIPKITIANYIVKMKICQTKILIPESLDSDIFPFRFSRHFVKDDAQPNRLCYTTYNSRIFSVIGLRVVGGAVLIHVLMPAAAPSLLQHGLPLPREDPVLFPDAFLPHREVHAPLMPS